MRWTAPYTGIVMGHIASAATKRLNLLAILVGSPHRQWWLLSANKQNFPLRGPLSSVMVGKPFESGPNPTEPPAACHDPKATFVDVLSSPIPHYTISLRPAMYDEKGAMPN